MNEAYAIARMTSADQRRELAGNGMPEPVTGQNVCPVCGGVRVRQWVGSRMGSHGPKGDNSALLWDGNSGIPWVWCEACGGDGTLTAAVERALIKE